MEMTDKEIITSYNQAKHKSTQLRILADLNCTTVGNIKKIVGLQEENVVKSEVEKIDEYVEKQKKLKPNHIVEVKEKPVKAAVKTNMEKMKDAMGIEEPKAAEPTIKIPDSIYNMAVTRLEELENILENARKEYAEIAEFLGMGA